jgi:hypothetical protein
MPFRQLDAHDAARSPRNATSSDRRIEERESVFRHDAANCSIRREVSHFAALAVARRAAPG